MPPMIPSGPTAPATVSPVNQGLQASGKLIAGLAILALERAIPKLGSTTPEGLCAVKALQTLSTQFAKPPAEMGRQEAKLMGDLASPSPSVGPEQADAFQSQIRRQQRSVGLPGADAAA